MRIVNDHTPSGIALKTQAQSSNPGITYNEANVSYDNSLYTYGGVYGYEDMFPSFSLSISQAPNLKIGQTNQLMLDQSITYNQVNASYNDSRYDYGGLYGYADIQPMISLATSPKPSIVSYADIYTVGNNLNPTISSNIPLGPGFFMFIPQ
jgi:hypothetical protein